MGTDNLFQKKKLERKARKEGNRKAKPNSYLIVSEGSATEVNYFRGIVNEIKDKRGGNLSVIENPHIDIEGGGRSTISLIEYAKKKVSRAKIIYDNVWVVFDKDDFSDFDRAIKLALQEGFKVAWSNQCFEYWLYLHFEYSDVAMHRTILYDKLNAIFLKSKMNSKYNKNEKQLYSIVSKNSGVEKAIKHAKKRMMGYEEGKDLPSSYDPGTTVYKLVEELNEYLK